MSRRHPTPIIDATGGALPPEAADDPDISLQYGLMMRAKPLVERWLSESYPPMAVIAALTLLAGSVAREYRLETAAATHLREHAQALDLTAAPPGGRA